MMKACPRRLLILGCTRAKRHDPDLLPAVERYDGPAFRVVRRYLAARPADPPDIYVLSAEHGLLEGTRPTSDYDRRLTAARASALLPTVQAELRQALSHGRFGEVFVHAGSIYQRLLRHARNSSDDPPTMTFASGPPGRKLAALRNWLYGGPPANVIPALPAEGPPRIRGIAVNLTREQVGAIARRALLREGGANRPLVSWYVLFDGARVPPKWLITQLTGLAPAAFRTAEACRLLAQLGIEARRT